MIKDRRASCASGIIKGWDPKKRKRCLGSHRIAISDIGEDKSFADDLNKERGIVSGRVALLLRSAEIKPLFYRFVLYEHLLPLHSLWMFEGHYLFIFKFDKSVWFEGLTFKNETVSLV